MDRKLTNAFHESGHAALEFALGHRFRAIILDPPYVDFDKPFSRMLRSHAIARSASGPAAEAIACGRSRDWLIMGEWGASISDRQNALDAAKGWFPGEGDRDLAFLRRITSLVLEFMEQADVWAAVTCLANELASAGVIVFDRAERLWQQFPDANRIAGELPAKLEACMDE